MRDFRTGRRNSAHNLRCVVRVVRGISRIDSFRRKGQKEIFTDPETAVFKLGNMSSSVVPGYVVLSSTIN